MCCAKLEAGWEPEVPAPLRQHPAGQTAMSLGIILPARPGWTRSPHGCSSNATSMGKLSPRRGVAGVAERQVVMAATGEHGFSLPLCSGLSPPLQHTIAPASRTALLCLLRGSRRHWEG